MCVLLLPVRCLQDPRLVCVCVCERECEGAEGEGLRE